MYTLNKLRFGWHGVTFQAGAKFEPKLDLAHGEKCKVCEDPP
jgi:hypothetical protein